MNQRARRRAFDRLIVPWPLLLGVLAGFGACCVMARLLADRNQFGHFERFHVLLSPETNYYPTASQVRALARSRLQRDKIAVVVGGDSVLQGTGQNITGLWTRKLQTD